MGNEATGDANREASSAVDLNYRYFGEDGKPPLVILHGLLGSSRNWTSVARKLSERYDTFALDLRNHGESPHTGTMSYPELVDDLGAFLDAKELERVHLLGHSLGGKAAMRFACEHNRRVESLIVADIAPKDYPPHYEKAFAAMKSIDLEHLRDRREAEEKLEPASSSWVFRQFLLTNLVRDKATGRFRWQCNLDTLIREVGQLARNPLEPGFCYPGPTLLITGALSDFVDDADIPAIQEHFPHLRTREIANASHNVHVENTPAFLDALEEFATQEWGCGI